jgi:hypothetical protein
VEQREDDFFLHGGLAGAGGGEFGEPPSHPRPAKVLCPEMRRMRKRGWIAQFPLETGG